MLSGKFHCYPVFLGIPSGLKWMGVPSSTLRAGGDGVNLRWEWNLRMVKRAGRTQNVGTFACSQGEGKVELRNWLAY
jgi:hypothetical protein